MEDGGGGGGGGVRGGAGGGRVRGGGGAIGVTEGSVVSCFACLSDFLSSIEIPIIFFI